jgi:hypothetical protein
VHVVGGAAPVVLNRVQGTIVLPTTVAMPLRVTSGWPDRATFAKEAPLLLQAVGLLTAHYATLGRDLAGTADTFPVPMGYEAAVAPHRLIWIT